MNIQQIKEQCDDADRVNSVDFSERAAAALKIAIAALQEANEIQHSPEFTVAASGDALRAIREVFE